MCNNILVSKRPGEPGCNDFVITQPGSIWIEYGVMLLYIVVNEDGVSVSSMPVKMVEGNDLDGFWTPVGEFLAEMELDDE